MLTLDQVSELAEQFERMINAYCMQEACDRAEVVEHLSVLIDLERTATKIGI